MNMVYESLPAEQAQLLLSDTVKLAALPLSPAVDVKVLTKTKRDSAGRADQVAPDTHRGQQRLKTAVECVLVHELCTLSPSCSITGHSRISGPPILELALAGSPGQRKRARIPPSDARLQSIRENGPSQRGKSKRLGQEEFKLRASKLILCGGLTEQTNESSIAN